ncbi:hypothetical protein AAHE18_09G126400 [Arachis hypogaea]
MDKEKYEKVLEACSLKKDLQTLSFGDQTIIGMFVRPFEFKDSSMLLTK